MASSEDEDRRRAEKARQVGLFRYSLIQDLLDSSLTTRERGRLARELADKKHTDPFGRQVRVSRGTIICSTCSTCSPVMTKPVPWRRWLRRADTARLAASRVAVVPLASKTARRPWSLAIA
ncbi:hypothetical protein [Streptomyces sp. NPDC003015]